MKEVSALKRLNHWDKENRYVFTIKDLKKIFHEDTPKRFKDCLKLNMGQ